MNTLVLLFHPDMGSSRVNARLIAALDTVKPDNVTVRDEYAENPNFTIDVEAEQRLMEQADRIVLQFPFYWYSSPALLKEWEDRVLTAGWAFGGARKLFGKELRLVVTTGSEAGKFSPDGDYKRTMDELLSPFEVVARKIDMRFVEPFLVQGCSVIDDETLNEAAAEYVKAITQ